MEQDVARREELRVQRLLLEAGLRSALGAPRRRRAFTHPRLSTLQRWLQLDHNQHIGNR